MPDFNERPDREFLDGHQQYLENTWRSSRAKWKDTFSFYELSYQVWKTAAQNESRGQYRPPTARTIIDHTADQFQALIPTVRREPRRDSDPQRVIADEAEVAMKEIMMDAAMHAKVNPWRLLGKHFNAFGYGILEMDLEGLDYALKSNRPPPAYWNPVRIAATNPGHVLIDPLEKVPNAAIKIVQMAAQDVDALVKSKKRLKHVEAFNMANRKPWEMVNLVFHWTGPKGWLTVREAGGDFLYQQRNSWNFIPFTHAFAGYGMEPPDLDKNDPQYMADGLLDPIKGTLKNQAQSATAKHTMVIEAAFSAYGTTRDPEEFVNALGGQGVLQGEALDYWKLHIQDVPRWVFQSGAEVDESIERSVGASARGGVRQPGVETVGQQAQLDNQALRKFIGSSMQEEHMASILAGWIARAVDSLPSLKDGIGAHGKHLKRSHIDGHYDFDVTFQVMDPVMEEIRRRSYLQEWDRGLMDDDTYWQKTGEQNITERRLRQNRQMVRRSLAVLARTAKITAQGMDELTEQDAAAVSEEVASGALGLEPQSSAPAGLEDGREPLSDRTAKPQRLDGFGASL
tara:strand:+ start:2550 stop:4259 length:1710 start_codon:yes stop_codon:yes gene_type:complete